MLLVPQSTYDLTVTNSKHFQVNNISSFNFKFLLKKLNFYIKDSLLYLNNKMLSPDQIERIYNTITSHKMRYGTMISCEELKKKCCPDVSEYKDKVLICMSYNFSRGGSWSMNQLISRMHWNQICLKNENSDDVKIYLGEVNGKHSEVILPFGEIFDKDIRDPYKIKDISRHVKIYESTKSHDGSYEDDDFLSNFKYIFDYSKREGKCLIVLRDDKETEYLFLVSSKFCDKYVKDETKINLKEVGGKDEVIEISSVVWDYVEDPKEIDEKLYSLEFLDNYHKQKFFRKKILVKK